jgi:nucleotide-binding universal stress UspA family protein
MKRVVIAYDGSKCADAALKGLERAALSSEVEAIVISVADVRSPARGDEPEGDREWEPHSSVRMAREKVKQALKNSRALAERACDRLGSTFPNWKIEALACAGSPAGVIVQIARERNAYLLVVGAHSCSVTERLFLGSVAHRVATEAPCSIRIARRRLRPAHVPLRILIAVDGSNDARSAIHEVAARNWPAGTEFIVLTVVDPMMQTIVAWPGGLTDQWPVPTTGEIAERISAMTLQAAAWLREAGRDAKVHLADGDPKSVLLREVEILQIDNVFLGARGVHHGGASFLGSLAAAVSGRALCSVEIVRSR